MKNFAVAMLVVTLAGCANKKALNASEAARTECSLELQSCKEGNASLQKRLNNEVTAKQLAEKRLEAYEDLAKRLRDAYGTDLAIEIRNGRMVVKLPNDILYDTGKAELKADGKKSLDKLAGVLKAEERNFQIAGHTDNQPVNKKSTTFKTNWELSTRRALSAVYYLEIKGVSSARLAAVGYGEHQPVTSNSSADAMAKNRRTEIVIMPKLDEIPVFPKEL